MLCKELLLLFIPKPLKNAESSNRLELYDEMMFFFQE